MVLFFLTDTRYDCIPQTSLYPIQQQLMATNPTPQQSHGATIFLYLLTSCFESSFDIFWAELISCVVPT